MLNSFEFIRSKIGSKIVVFLFILFFLVIISFVIVSYYQSQMAYLGNSINIAGKNRFLTSNLMLHISEYLNMEDNTKSSSVIKSAMNQLESNILALRQGGTFSRNRLETIAKRIFRGLEYDLSKMDFT